MARREILVDDIDGTEGASPQYFTFEGVNYEIDLNEENAAKFRDAIKPWADAARKAGRSGASPRRSTSGAGGKRDLAPIREWANANGYTVSARGRVPNEIIDAYDAAH